MITYDLSGKTALVTGSNRSIGKDMVARGWGKIVFTCSPAAYVHGAILPVDGGWLAR